MSYKRSHGGVLTENDGHENDGPSKLQNMKFQDMRLTDQCAGHEIVGHANAGREIAGKNTVITVLTEMPLHYIEVDKCLLFVYSYTHKHSNALCVRILMSQMRKLLFVSQQTSMKMIHNIIRFLVNATRVKS